MLLAFTALSFLLLGYELSLRLFPGDNTSTIERACYGGVFGLSLWLSTLWIAALLHVMVQSVLLARTTLAAAIGVALTIKRWRHAALTTRVQASPITMAVIVIGVLPILAWCEFVLWRGAILPPASHDALAYHLPKAVLYARAHGYEYFRFLDPRIRNIPSNYELLLAETMILTGSDSLTEWISTLCYVLWVIASAALARRWWKSDWWTTVAMAIFSAGVPVALLHSGADKNDLLTAFFMTAALVACGRWIAADDFGALVTAMISLVAAIGTKPQAAALALCAASFLLLRRISVRGVVVLGATAIVAFPLLGGSVYISNVFQQHSVIGVQTQQTTDAVIQYGDWPNLWQAPYVLLAAPFSRSPLYLVVPWEKEPWFWRRYEIFFSHLGIPFAICTLALPLAMVMTWRWEDGSRKERLAVTVAALATLIIMLPVRFVPHGLYAISLPRYALFLVPVVFAWTIGALVSHAARFVSFVVIVVGALFFAWYAVDDAVNDVFAPLTHVLWVREHPTSRIVPFDPFRAGEIVDAFAGPHDRVAVDAAFGTWLEPLFGANFQRPVDFIPPGQGAPVLRDDVKWVVVDRAWNITWGDPRFRDLSQVWQYLTRGQPAPEDLRVLNALRADRRFRLVFYNPRTNQAVFQRIR